MKKEGVPQSCLTVMISVFLPGFIWHGTASTGMISGPRFLEPASRFPHVFLANEPVGLYNFALEMNVSWLGFV